MAEAWKSNQLLRHLTQSSSNINGAVSDFKSVLKLCVTAT